MSEDSSDKNEKEGKEGKEENVDTQKWKSKLGDITKVRIRERKLLGFFVENGTDTGQNQVLLR